MHREDCAAGDEEAGAACDGRAESAAFEGDIFAGESCYCAGGPVFLGLGWSGGDGE
jgi:hypothetical protein